MKTIWIINQYASTPIGGLGGRTHHFACELARQGHRVYHIGARWHHYLTDDHHAETAPAHELGFGYTFVRVNVPKYQGAHDKKRVLNWFLFARRLRSATKLLPKPDVVLYSSPSLIPARTAQKLAQRHDAQFVFEVRDIWPLTLTQIGGFSPKHPLIRFMQGIEDRCYRATDLAISPLAGAYIHMQSRGLPEDRFLWVPNGYSADETEHPDALPSELETQFPDSPFTVGYAGTLGTANNLDLLLDAATLLRDHMDIAFVLIGQGAQRTALEARARERDLHNIRFLGSVRKSQIPSVLAKFDLGYIGWHDSPLYRFGISPNKLVDYMRAGLPVLHAFAGENDPVQKHTIGISVASGRPEDLAGAITAFKALPPETRRNISRTARDLASNTLEYGALTRTIAKRLKLT